MRQTLAGRAEEDVFRCLAWLYDGFRIPTRLHTAALKE